MASTEALGPISRHVLCAYYYEHPFPTLRNDLLSLSAEIQSMAFDLLKDSSALQDENLLIEEAISDPIYEIERNLWKNREHITEILSLIGYSRWPPILPKAEVCELYRVLIKIKDMFKESLKKLVSYQDMISERVFNTVTNCLPPTTRKTLINRLKEQEIIGKQKVDDLVASGASTGASCALLWEQHMDIRRQLAEACNTVCQLRFLKDHNWTVPTDVICSRPKIKNDEWPMEEQREHYGSPLHCLTATVLSIRLFLSLLMGRFDESKLTSEQVDCLDKVVDVYTREFQRFIAFISEVFTGSPFFKIYEFEEINIAAGQIHEVSVEVEAINSKVAWEFRLISPDIYQNKINLEIEFSVELTESSGNKTTILPKKLCNADIGSFVAVRAGNYKIMWDNSDTLYVTKFLLRKVVCTSPVDLPNRGDT